MSHGAPAATRLTLYALVSAIEEDIRSTISNELGHQKTPAELLGPDVWQTAAERFVKEYGSIEQDAPLSDILLYVDFGDLSQILNRYRTLLARGIADHIRDIAPTLESILAIRNRVAHSRPLHASDFATVWDFSARLVEHSSTIWSRVQGVLKRIEVEPSFVLNLKIPPCKPEEVLRHNLPNPDFDETGFIGRENVVSRLISLCKGPYPVITIVGEGGLGKTALALKVAYDLLDLPDQPFEAVVWTSAKTRQLSAGQIKEIDNAIRDSLGMIQSVSHHLSGQRPEDPVREVLEYMGMFRILLVLDNLETVVDDRIRSFMQGLPAGSKVLITSRIGLGAFEFPVKLERLSDLEAVQLLRTLSRMRSVPALAKVENNRLARYCTVMKNNPGYIKWFVSAVQAGQRPEDVLDKPDVFLDFCMSNVYHYLTEASKRVLKSMQAIPGRLSQAELAFLNGDMEVTSIQAALQQLLTTNMVSMLSIPHGSSFESTYDVSELARLYLEKHHPLRSEDLKDLTKRRLQLRAAGEQLAAQQTSNPYSFDSVRVRSKRDLALAKDLLDALKAIRARRLDQAEKKIEDARRLAPEYFEVHRIEALLKLEQGNVVGAKVAYEAALEIEPNSAPLHFWYAGLLMRHLDDTEAALTELQKAGKIDPSAIPVQIEIARASLYLMKFPEARIILDALLRRTDIPGWEARKVYDLHLQWFARRADYGVQAQRDYLASLDWLENLKESFERCPQRLRDKHMLRTLAKAVYTADRCIYCTEGTYKAKATRIRDWLVKESYAEQR